MKTYWKWANRFMRVGFLTWLVETVFFLFYYGWHLKAASATERFLDNFSAALMILGLFFWFLTVIELIEKVIKYEEE